MLAKVIFTPNSIQEKGDITYTDIKVELSNGEQVNIYAQEDSPDWNAFGALDKGQLIEVEQTSRDGKTFWRLTQESLDRLLNGGQHPFNGVTGSDPFENVTLLCELVATADNELAETDLNIELSEDAVQRLATTAFIQSQD